ncbi:MAG: phosphoribosylformylglycinamidine synthase subunit PurL [Spirochaetes bacterium]|nr:phosphoribosylformylglycinamidine synthase subunit PurL [Spirochaetota bacterium]
MERWEKEGLTYDEYKRIIELIGREPNDLELAMFGVMWSEHCSYKNSKALLKLFYTKNERVLQGPGENAGIIDIGDGYALTFKVESHNHPSAVEPFQGAATGVGGIVRDIFVMGARPIALLNSLRFGNINLNKTKKLFDGVIKGISDYGNKIGVPDVSGEIYFNTCYNDNPLVNAMCVGLLKKSNIKKGVAKGKGNPVILVGHTTGRDGIKGASFASENLTEQSEEKRSHVQVADPFMEKLLIEATMELIAHKDIIGIQDLGAAGLTSSSCEIASRGNSGIEIDVSKVITREPNMTPAEIMLSESQERMLLVIKKGKEKDAFKIFKKWDLHASIIGYVTDDGMIRIKNKDEIVANIPAKALAEGSPTNLRPYKYPAYLIEKNYSGEISKIIFNPDIEKDFLSLISSPNICSREWVFKQYDHMVQRRTAIRPGGDASVLYLKEINKAISLTIDCNSRYCFLNPYDGAKIAVFEAARNIVATGGLPLAITDCLNFASPEEEEIYYQFRAAILGITEACKLLNTPIISGNVSFYNQSEEHKIYPTPVIGMVGLIEKPEYITKIDFKKPIKNKYNFSKNNISFYLEKFLTDIKENDYVLGDAIILVGETRAELGGSEYLSYIYKKEIGPIPQIEGQKEILTNDTLLSLIKKGLINSAHDISDGGLIVSLAECCFNNETGVLVNIQSELKPHEFLFSETQGRFIISVNHEYIEEVINSFKKNGIFASHIGFIVSNSDLSSGTFNIKINDRIVIKKDIKEIKKIWKESLENLIS